MPPGKTEGFAARHKTIPHAFSEAYIVARNTVTHASWLLLETKSKAGLEG